MKSANLTRGPSTDEGTFGTLSTSDGLLKFNTVELPWRSNARGKSCIPAGSYQCVWHKSPSKGWVYLLKGTEPRTDVLIHVGNWAGDVDKGWVSDLLGCISVGKGRAPLLPDQKKHPGAKLQQAITGSAPAIKALFAWGNTEPFTLNIVNA